MVKGCGNNCMKYSLFVFNLIFVIVGVALLALGIFVLIKSKDVREIVETPDAGAILVVIVGFSVFLIAFFGCCGALQEGQCMLNTYAVVVGLLFFVEVAGAVLLLVYAGKLSVIAQRGVTRGVWEYKPADPKDSVTQIMDNLQWNLKCCGANQTNDWQRRPDRAYFDGRLPQSCCFDPLDNLKTGQECSINNGVTKPFNTPCARALDEFLKIFLGVMSAFMISIAVIQLIAACFACSIAKASGG